MLDEPTASLPQYEVNLLIDVLRKYANQGQTILYVSHRLEEVQRLADAATVLRDGEVAANLEQANPDPKRLVTSIMGRELETVDKQIAGAATSARTGEPILTLRSKLADASGSPDLVVHPGECVAIAGLLGSGRTSLLQRIFGVRPRPDEELSISGDVLEPEEPYAAMKAGLAYVPEDRVADASF